MSEARDHKAELIERLKAELVKAKKENERLRRRAEHAEAQYAGARAAANSLGGMLNR